MGNHREDKMCSSVFFYFEIFNVKMTFRGRGLLDQIFKVNQIFPKIQKQPLCMICNTIFCIFERKILIAIEDLTGHTSKCLS